MIATQISETTVRETLRHVIDPEIGWNIVDLGLIYNTAIADGSVKVTLTLTTLGCPMHDSISWGVKSALLNLEGVTDAEVAVVWDPPWHPSMMSEEARTALGVRNF